jgi:hypothetical protein
MVVIMNDTERDLDLALAECEAENRLLRARNDRLEKVAEAAKTMVSALQNMADFEQWDKALTRLEKTLEGA